jgi:ABC-type transport system involved in multi-copper enzyme maturation permease subunit
MNTQLAQLGKMTYYEFRMHWRGRALLVLTLAIAVLNLFSIWIFSANMLPIELDATYAAAGLISAPLSVTIALLLPIIVSDTIPKDQQYGVRELLDTLPVPRWVYLGGKMLGMWAGVLLGLLIAMIANGIFYQFTLGNLNLRVYLEMWLVAGVALLVINGSLGVLIPVGQPNRRRAVILMVALFVVLFASIGQVFDTESLLAYINPFRPAIVMYYIGSMGENVAGGVSIFSSRDVLVTIIVGLFQLVLVAALAWGWLRWKENRV